MKYANRTLVSHLIDDPVRLFLEAAALAVRAEAGDDDPDQEQEGDGADHDGGDLSAGGVALVHEGGGEHEAVDGESVRRHSSCDLLLALADDRAGLGPDPLEVEALENLRLGDVDVDGAVGGGVGEDEGVVDGDVQG